MAELANCKSCGKVFVKVSSPYCPECLKEQEKKFDKVYDYIKQQENRMSTVSQVHEATQVETALIYHWIHEGRLLTTMFPNLGYPCKSCGKIIQEGSICDDCRKRLERDIARLEKEEDLNTGDHRTTYHT
ncbi:hypothetical protein EWH99_04545 [Sporolactobacillus sp. THM7-7]|nr:hypothetical protein EWH99_04545 [Sporolactobacillus sp. THM7-7]